MKAYYKTPAGSVPTPVPETVSRQHACQRLDIGLRQLRGMIKAGRLAEVGEGHRRRITSESLAAEVIRREKRKSGNQKAEIVRNPPETLPNFRVASLADQTERGDNASVLSRFPVRVALPDSGLELLSLSRAAITVGVSERLLRTVVERGDLPSVQVGARRRIARDVLTEWARGKTEAQR